MWVISAISFCFLLGAQHGFSLQVLKNEGKLNPKPKSEECDPGVLSCFGPSESTINCQKYMRGEQINLKKGPRKSITSLLQQQRILREEGSYYHEKHDVKIVKIHDPEYFPLWTCYPPTCKDDLTGNRGDALLFFPPNSESKVSFEKRLIFIHGGSWYWSSPQSYEDYLAHVSKVLDMPVLAIDYTLSPMGQFEEVLKQVGKGVKWLATEDLGKYTTPAFNENRTQRKGVQPDIYIMGDSAGGGTALSALVAQATNDGLPESDGYQIAGGSLLSPWINIVCNSPSYFSQAYAKTPRDHIMLGDVCFAAPNDDTKAYIKTQWDNCKDYTGPNIPLTHPVANPIYASREVLSKLKPVAIYTGISEFLQADTVLFAGRAASAGAVVEAHLYDGMWHTFSENTAECSTTAEDNELVLITRSLADLLDFIDYMAKNENRPRPKVPSYLYMHYEFPKKHDSTEYFHFKQEI